ncbi:ATPase, P-type (transporting), HAD superfamily, subfamily IC [Winogradskyella thalassocola]|uniref:ATPase, P-type (Transporting), HAD superfamily, subfamily IC n=1 Tax=Winogradskyella thalassocola TaxID=262004 RepID=A0A1G8JBA7_9FLAO|nr:ATPase, P-type (transporting), HAD superfamily, subfamily IC [Winogradskyella thalassocola]
MAKLVFEVESLSDHLLAKAIANDLKLKYTIDFDNKASNVNAIQGKGIQANYESKKAFIGNVKLMEDSDIKVNDSIHSKMDQLLQNGHAVMLAAFNNEIVGLISGMDLPRKTAISTLLRLKEIGIKYMIMLTGDHQNVGDAIAKQIGLMEAKGNLLPEDKISAIKQLIKRDKKNSHGWRWC